MKRVLHLLLGYTLLQAEIEDLRKILNIANKNNIHILEVSIDDKDAVIKIYSRNEKALFFAFKAECIEVSVLNRKGLKELLNRYKHRVGLSMGIILMFAVLYISPKFIWEINITGVERLSKEYVCEMLKDEGVYVGAFSPFVNRRAVYMNIVSKTNDISWISVNFKGSSANVEIVERDYEDVSDVQADAANIVASKDGQIVESDIICGKLIVKNGETVKKGDILVSGVYDTGMMGTRFVYAKANVYAAVSDEFIIEVPLNNSKKTHIEEKVVKRTFNLFGKSINFYKNYSILDGNYDTISREENWTFAGVKSLPMSVSTVTAVPYTIEAVFLTEEEALERARKDFYNRLDIERDYFEVVSVDETYSVKDSVLIYIATVEAIENIALTSELKIN